MQLLETPQTQHFLTVAEYMSADIEDRTELLGGIVYDVSPRNESHRYAVRRLHVLLARGLPPGYIVQSQDAIAVSGWHGKDAPEVDVAVITDKYHSPAAAAVDALAFVEVSDTTYRTDRKVKIPLYVTAGVPSWIVNIGKRRAEFYGTIADLELESGHVFHEGQTIEIAGVEIAFADLFPPEASVAPD